MKFGKTFSLLLGGFFLAALSGCTESSAPAGPGCAAANSSCTNAAGPTIPTSSTRNVPLYIGDPSTTGNYTYPNEPLVSVTVCTPNHTSSAQCQTISNVLLDTGSSGLRVFASAMPSNVQLTQQSITVQGEVMSLAECAQFGTGADWGPVQNGDVLMGNQTATNVPIQVINIGFNSVPGDCASLCPDTDPCTAGYNGILGVGLFTQDCGANCSNTADDTVNPGVYYGCDSTGCYSAYSGNCGSDGVCVIQAPLAQQVVNPIAAFASGFNNGVVLTLPSVGASGTSAITSGNLQLGIGTPSSITVYPADPNGMDDLNGPDFTTVFEGTTYGGSAGSTFAFIDSGSNGIFFPSGVTACTDGSGLYCPGSTLSLSAAMQGFSGTPSSSVSFSIGDADALFNSGNSAFSNLGGAASDDFDWGLPFFFGRSVYVGLNGATATINSTPATGPYWAF